MLISCKVSKEYLCYLVNIDKIFIMLNYLHFQHFCLILKLSRIYLPYDKLLHNLAAYNNHFILLMILFPRYLKSPELGRSS